MKAQMTGYNTKQHIQANTHFFAASVFTWAQTTDTRTLPELIKLMEKEGAGYNLFLVPVAYDKDYAIDFYQPQVDGTQWLGFFEGKKK
jgi:hypothetical protein